MVSPYKWFTAGPSTSEQKRQPPQKAIPFFFRSVGSEGPPYKASHLGLAVWLSGISPGAKMIFATRSLPQRRKGLVRPTEAAIWASFRATAPTTRRNPKDPAVYMVHDDIYTGNSKIREAIQSLRVEKFSKDHSWYVMVNTIELDTPIPYDDLWLVKQDRPLSPNFIRGYGMVWLPKKLQDWYSARTEKHSQFLEHPIIKRWQYLQS